MFFFTSSITIYMQLVSRDDCKLTTNKYRLITVSILANKDQIRSRKDGPRLCDSWSNFELARKLSGCIQVVLSMNGHNTESYGPIQSVTNNDGSCVCLLVENSPEGFGAYSSNPIFYGMYRPCHDRSFPIHR